MFISHQQSNLSSEAFLMKINSTDSRDTLNDTQSLKDSSFYNPIFFSNKLKEKRGSIDTLCSLETNASYSNASYCKEESSLSMYFNTSHFNYLQSNYRQTVNMNKTKNYIAKDKLNSLSNKQKNLQSTNEYFCPYSFQLETANGYSEINLSSGSTVGIQKRKGWVCLYCMNFNYDKRKFCNICTQIKTIVSDDQIQYRTVEVKEANKDAKRKTDWKCAKCFNLNYSFRNKCNCCHISHEESDRYLQAQTEFFKMNSASIMSIAKAQVIQ